MENVEELKLLVERELRSLIETRQNLDLILGDMKKYTALILSIDRRLTVIEDRFKTEDQLERSGLYR